MKNIVSIPIFLFILTLVFNCKEEKRDDLTDPFPEYNSTISWKQEKFILSTFHAIGETPAIYTKALQLTKEAGLNLVELTFLDTYHVNLALDAAEKVGIDVIVEDLDIFSGFQDNIPVLVEKNIAKRINEIKKYSIVKGYYVWDEPYHNNFDKVRYLRDLFKKYDPEKLAFSVIFPSYGIYNWRDGSYRTYVDSYLKIVDPDVVSFDYYPFRKETDQIIRSDLWKDFGYLRKKALEYNKPLWFYFQAVALDPLDVKINIERMKAQMYAALAYGVKGLSFYKTSELLFDSNCVKTELYDEVKQLNSEVKNLGCFLFPKKSEKIYHTSINTGDEELSSYFLDDFQHSDLITAAPANLIIGIFGDSDGDKKYILISNPNHQAEVAGKVKFKSPQKITRFNKKENVEEAVPGILTAVDISIPPGDCILFILQ